MPNTPRPLQQELLLHPAQYLQALGGLSASSPLHDNGGAAFDVKAVTFGALGNNVADDSAAFQAAHDALPASGGVILVPPGTYKVGGVSFTKPVELRLGGALVGKAGVPLLTVTGANLKVVGSDRTIATVTPASGQPVFVFKGQFPGVPSVGGTGAACIHLSHVTFDGSAGGLCVFDASVTRSPAFQFYEGDVTVEHCRVANFAGDALSFGVSFYYQTVRKNYFYLNGRAIVSDNNSDAWYAKNTFTQGTGAQITCSGPNIHIDDNVFLGNGNAGVAAPDVLVVPTISDGTGWVWVTRNRFGTERETFTPDRVRVRVKHPTDVTATCAPVWVSKNMFIGPQVRAISGITRAGNVVTVTMTDPHWMPVSTVMRMSISEVVDTSFNGTFTATATGTHTFTYPQTGSNGSSTTPNSFGKIGWARPLDICAIEIDQPVYGWTITENHFHEYGVVVNDAAFGRFDLLDHNGHNQFFGNHFIAPRYSATVPFKNGGRQFDRIEALGLSAHTVTETPRDSESFGTLNKLWPSEDFSQDWTIAGVTATPGQTDPWGTTRANLITRDGTATDQHIARGINVTGLTGDTLYFSFWAKAGTLDTLLVILGDDTTSAFLKQVHLKLSPQWQQFQVPLAGYAADHFHQIAFYPGDDDQRAGTVYLCAVSAADRVCGYVPTTHLSGEAVLDTAVGNRFQRTVALSSVRGVNRGAGPAVGSATAIGSTGTCVLDAGSSDVCGSVTLTPGGAGVSTAGVFVLTFETVRPGSNQPVTTLTLASGATGTWDQRAAAQVYATNMSSVTVLWDNNGVVLTSGADYRVTYTVADRAP